MQDMSSSSLPAIHFSLGVFLGPFTVVDVAGRELAANDIKLQLQGWTGKATWGWLCPLLGSKAVAKQYRPSLRPFRVSVILRRL